VWRDLLVVLVNPPWVELAAATPKGHAVETVVHRNWLIHQNDPIDHAITWSTLTTLLPTWAKALQSTFEEPPRCSPLTAEAVPKTDQPTTAEPASSFIAESTS
jgi:hypothetical protein